MQSGCNFYKLEIDVYIIEEIRELSRRDQEIRRSGDQEIRRSGDQETRGVR
jgi:hypothetical protein